MKTEFIPSLCYKTLIDTKLQQRRAAPELCGHPPLTFKQKHVFLINTSGFWTFSAQLLFRAAERTNYSLTDINIHQPARVSVCGG